MRIKNILFFVIVCVVGCLCPIDAKNLSTWMEKNGKLKVLSTTAMIDDLVGQIGGEHVDRETLIVGEIDPHSYELVKGDDEKLSHAQIIFSNGLGLEHGASLRYRLQQHPHAVYLGNVIQKKLPEKMIFIDQQLDPHIWMDISLWVEAIDPIVLALSEKDPAHKESYLINAEKLRAEMMKVHEEIRTKIQKVPPKKRYLVTSHDAFNYFTRAYLADDYNQWQKHCAAPEGLAPDGQLSVKDIQRIIEYLHQYQVTVVFHESNVSKDSLKKIVSSCQKKGLKVTLSKAPLYGDAIGSKTSGADSYLKMIAHNANILLNHWENE